MNTMMPSLGTARIIDMLEKVGVGLCLLGRGV